MAAAGSTELRRREAGGGTGVVPGRVPSGQGAAIPRRPPMGPRRGPGIPASGLLPPRRRRLRANTRGDGVRRDDDAPRSFFLIFRSRSESLGHRDGATGTGSALRLPGPVPVGPPWPIPMFYFYTLHQTLRKKEWSYDTEYYELVVSTVWYRTMVGTYGTVLVGTGTSTERPPVKSTVPWYHGTVPW